MLAKGIIARKDEKARIKRVKEFTKQGIAVPDKDLTPIADPEVHWKTTDVTWLTEEVRKAKAKEEKRR